MQKISTLIIDDEHLNREHLKHIIQLEFQQLEVIGEAGNIIEAETIIRQKKPQLLLLDVEMPGGNGFKLLEKFDSDEFYVIFITAFQDYLLKAFKFSAIDYVLKPIDKNDFAQAINKVEKDMAQKTNFQDFAFLKTLINTKDQGIEKIPLSTANGIEFVKTMDILYFDSSEHITKLVRLNDDDLNLHKNIKVYENLLDPKHFFRCHQSFLVNLNQVKRLAGQSIIMENGDEIPISRAKKNDFLNLLGN